MDEADIIAALGWKSLAKNCVEGSSLEFLTINVESPLLANDRACWMQVLRTIVDLGNSWFREQGAKKIKVIGKL